MWSIRPRLSLLARFGLVSAAAVAVLGFFLIRDLSAGTHAEALTDARSIARLATDLELAPRLTPLELQEGLKPETRLQLGGSLAQTLRASGVVRLKLWNPDGKVVYSDDPEIEGRSFPVGEQLGAALDGRIGEKVTELRAAENANDRFEGKAIEVYVPVRFRWSGPPDGAFEVYLSYDAVAARIEARARRTLLITLGGLVLLWAALFRLVAEASARLRHQAEADALTGLPNRNRFQRDLRRALMKAGDDTRVAVLLLDLDGFKEVNDTLGHHTGDLLLRQVGPRLRDSLPPGATVARLGGDEFAVLLPAVADPEAALAVADGLAVALARPFELDGTSLHAEASVGIALSPDHGRDGATLLQRADVAMYEAKRAGARSRVYDPADDPYSASRLMLLGELPRALERDELVLHYQPKIGLADGRPVGVEALVRWQHPQRGLLSPGEFVPLAERTALIRPLTLWVLERALRQAREWRAEGLELEVAVNLSAASLLDGSVPHDVARLLGASGVPPSGLALEITESLIMADPVRAGEVLRLLNAMGVALSIDDYGTGHSSLAYLKRLPVCELKIDRSFIGAVATDARDASIVRSTVELGHTLGLRVVAEGVEDAAAQRRLAALGCDLAQGYHICRPAPAAEIARWARAALLRTLPDAA
jgi:diguanylate cyclase (GGDEF)-like protein